MSEGSTHSNGASEIVQRNFGLTVEQDQWLRERAFRRDLNGRSSKAELVRDALDAYIASHPTLTA